MNVDSSFVVFSFRSLTATFAQHLFVVTCRILEMALFRKDDIYQEDENLHPGGNAEGTQVAVEYNDPVVRTPGGADAEYLLLSFCHMLIM